LKLIKAKKILQDALQMRLTYSGAFFVHDVEVIRKIASDFLEINK
jgi:hypothetical protein